MENPVATLSAVSDLPQSLIDELAIGTRTFEQIFAMHGVAEVVRDFVRTSPVLARLVEERKRDIENSGEMVKHHARYGMELASTAMMLKLNDPMTPASVVGDYYKAFRDTAFPKNQVEVGTGEAKFTITFNLGDAKSPTEIDITPPKSSGSGDENWGEIPAYISKANADLVYSE
jgi:hypothetical protein